jgi:four helix bundle protein
MEKMKKLAYDLEERLLEYSVRIIKVVEQLPNTRVGNHVAGQLLRSGTSPYPNHGEAQAAESPKDFIHKLRISLKELWESQRWLKLIQQVPLITNEIKLRSEATSLFDVRCWTFDVRRSSFKKSSLNDQWIHGGNYLLNTSCIKFSEGRS